MQVLNILWIGLLLTIPQTLALNTCTGQQFGYKAVDPEDPSAYFVCLGILGNHKYICGIGSRFDEQKQDCIERERALNHQGKLENVINVNQNISLNRPIIFNFLLGLLWNKPNEPQHSPPPTKQIASIISSSIPITEISAVSSDNPSSGAPSSTEHNSSTSSEDPSSTDPTPDSSTEGDSSTSEDPSSIEPGSSTEGDNSTSDNPSSTDPTPDNSTEGDSSTSEDPSSIEPGSSTEGDNSTSDDPSSTDPTPESSTEGDSSTSEDLSSIEPGSSTEGDSSTSDDPSSTDPTPDSSTEGDSSTSEDPSSIEPGSSTEGDNSTSDDPSSTDPTPDSSTEGDSSTSEDLSSIEPGSSTEGDSSTSEDLSSTEPTPGSSTEGDNSTSDDPSSTNPAPDSSTKGNSSSSKNPSFAQPTPDSSTERERKSSSSKDQSLNNKIVPLIASSAQGESTKFKNQVIVPSVMKLSVREPVRLNSYTPQTIPEVFDQSSVCNSLPNGAYLRHPKLCNKFYVCANGRAIPRHCPGVLYFDIRKKVCNFPSQVDCSNVNEPVSVSKARIPSTHLGIFKASNSASRRNPTPDCSSLPNGAYVRDLGICSKFYICANGRAIPRQCPRGLLFDTKIQYCNFPSLVDCSYNEAQAAKDIATFYLMAESAKPDCTDKPDGISIRDSNMCNKYYTCVGGKPVFHFCSPGKWFDSNSLICKNKRQVECNI